NPVMLCFKEMEEVIGKQGPVDAAIELGHQGGLRGRIDGVADGVVGNGRQETTIRASVLHEVLLRSDQADAQVRELAAIPEINETGVNLGLRRVAAQQRAVQVLNLVHAAFDAGFNGQRHLETIDEVAIENRAEVVQPLRIRVAAEQVVRKLGD